MARRSSTEGTLTHRVEGTSAHTDPNIAASVSATVTAHVFVTIHGNTTKDRGRRGSEAAEAHVKASHGGGHPRQEYFGHTEYPASICGLLRDGAATARRRPSTAYLVAATVTYNPVSFWIGFL